MSATLLEDEWADYLKIVGLVALVFGAMGGCCVGSCAGRIAGKAEGECVAVPGRIYIDGQCIEGRRIP